MEDVKRKKIYRFIWLFFQIPSALFITFGYKYCTNKPGDKVTEFIVYPNTGRYVGYSLSNSMEVGEISIESVDTDYCILSFSGDSYTYLNVISEETKYEEQSWASIKFSLRIKDNTNYYYYQDEENVLLLLPVSPEKFHWIPDQSLRYLKDVFYLSRISNIEYTWALSSTLDFANYCMASSDSAEYACYFYQDKKK
ncbi:MAG: hypothetical protein MJ178_07775 [Treponemataceae bacterium]|nr:hypothetical protein [Treponemataceae bacterium]